MQFLRDYSESALAMIMSISPATALAARGDGESTGGYTAFNARSALMEKSYIPYIPCLSLQIQSRITLVRGRVIGYARSAFSIGFGYESELCVLAAQRTVRIRTRFLQVICFREMLHHC